MTKFLRKTLLAVLMALCGLAIMTVFAFTTACTPDEASAHTITFVENGGTEVEDITAKAGDTITPPQDPTYAGREFAGWYLEEDCSGERQTLPEVMPDEDVTYYAKWTVLPQITLNLDGGQLDGVTGTTLGLKAGEDVYAFMQQYVPTKNGYRFGAWYYGSIPLVENVPMPASGLELTAKWKVPYTVKVKKYDFLKYEYNEDPSLQKTEYEYDGTVVSGLDYQLENYTVNETYTKPVTVEDGAGVVLEIYVASQYTAYIDAFGGSDAIFLLATDPDHLILQRTGLGGEEGLDRVQSTSFDSQTGLFTFDTGKGFKLEGILAGSYEEYDIFYYFMDTVEQKFNNYNGGPETLEIKGPDEVIYTDAQNKTTTGGYKVSLTSGRFVFVADGQEKFEFVLAYKDGEMYFRLSDGIVGAYMAVTSSGYMLMYFDGFGGIVYVDSGDNQLEMTYDVVGENTVYINEVELTVRLAPTPELGDVLDGMLRFQDGYQGEYSDNAGNKLTLDGFDGATLTQSSSQTKGTYEIVYDDSWYAWFQGQTSVVASQVSDVNMVLVFTDDKDAQTSWLLDFTFGDDNEILTRTFKKYDPATYDPIPGAYYLTNNFTLYGTQFTVTKTTSETDSTPAFLYVRTDATADLWYGRYSESYSRVVYTLCGQGEFAKSGNVWTLSIDETTLKFNNFDADKNTVDFAGEELDESAAVVFFDNENGKLTVDAAGEATYTPKSGEAKKVEYEVTETGLLNVFVFEGLPASVSSVYGLFEYDYGEGAQKPAESKVYDLTGKVYEYVQYSYPSDGSEPTAITTKLVVCDNTHVFLGLQFSSTSSDGSEEIYMYYIIMGGVTAVAEKTGEYNFVMDDTVYWSTLDMISGSAQLLEEYGQFRYKVDEDQKTFLFYDGMEYNLTGPNGGSFVSDGYGNATLIVRNALGRSTTYEGVYGKVGYLIEFDYGESNDYYLLKPDDFENPESYTFIDTEEADLIGTLEEVYFVGAQPYYGNSAMFLDGNGGVWFEEVYSAVEDGKTVTKVNDYYGSYVMTDNAVEIEGVTNYMFLEVQLEFNGGGSRTVALLLTLRGETYYYMGYYVVRDDASMGDYNLYDDEGNNIGLVQGSDGYNSDDAMIFIEEGNVLEYGYMSRGNIDSSSYNSAPKFTSDVNGNVVLFTSYDENGAASKQYVFDLQQDGETLKAVYRSLYYGTVAEYKNGALTGRYMTLDGHGNAELFDKENNSVAKGVYSVKSTSSSGSTVYYQFTATDADFVFITQTVQVSSSSSARCFVSYDESDYKMLVNSDWSVLYIDGYCYGMYVDKYGNIFAGEYVHLSGDYYYLYYRNQRLYFKVDAQNGTFSVVTADEAEGH